MDFLNRVACLIKTNIVPIRAANVRRLRVRLIDPVVFAWELAMDIPEPCGGDAGGLEVAGLP